MIHGLTTGLLIFIILHLHGHRLILQAREATAQVAWMERQNMLEQEKNGALSQFIDMISHETRNALAVVNMTISNGTISDAQRSRMTRMISNLTDLIDRCNQAVRIDSKLQKVEKRTAILSRSSETRSPACAMPIASTYPVLLWHSWRPTRSLFPSSART
ncbi:hypothetical protein ACFSHQ_25910 [Gemmobacter lanyuensis]